MIVKKAEYRLHRTGNVVRFGRSNVCCDAAFHYLAADPSLRAQTQNVNVAMGQATYIGKMVEVEPDVGSPLQTVLSGPAS